MSVFDLNGGEADSRLRELLRQPESTPDTFAGFWSAAANSLAVAPLESLRAASPVLDAFGKSMAFAQGGEGAQLNGRQVTDLETLKRETVGRIGENDLRADLTPAINRLTPDPRVSGTASQLVFGFGKTIGKAVGYSLIGGNVGGALAFGLDEGVNETMRLEDKGVDTGTAAQAGTVHGLTMAAAAALPIAGKTKLQTAGIVVAGGPASYIVEQATIREILRSAQYERIAEDYKPFDPMGLAVSTAAPAVFGTLAHIRMLRGEPRGIRNHNPGNLVKSDIPWNGKLAGGDRRFESFETAEQGIAALARNLLTYQERHGLDTVRAIVERWAPPSENKTGRYVAAVAKELEVTADAKLDLGDSVTLSRLTKAIIRHENGKQPYSDAQIDGSVRAAIEGRAIRPTPEQADASRVAYLAAHADSGRLGREGDIAAANAHVQALDESARMLDEGLAVDVAQRIEVDPGKLDEVAAFFDRLRAEQGAPLADDLAVMSAPEGGLAVAARFATVAEDIRNGLNLADTALARLRNSDPARFEVIAGQIQTIIGKFDELRATRVSVNQYLNQNRLSPELHNLMIGFDEAAGNPKRLAAMLARYAGTAQDARGMPDGDLVADSIDATRNDMDARMGDKLPGATPEQRKFYQSLIDQPNKEIPTGELDESGMPIARRAAELMDEAESGRLQADEMARGIDAAVICLLGA